MLAKEIKKRKLTFQEIQLLSLKQVLLNQVALLRDINFYKLSNDSKDLAKRIDEYLKTGE